MIKKSIPLILTLFIFATFLSYATLDRTKESNISSLGNNNNNYIKEDIYKKSMQNNKVNSMAENDNFYKNRTDSMASDTQIVNKQNINNKIQKTDINTLNYLDSLQCINYKLKAGETLTDIARKYENTCNLNTTVKMIKSINKINDENNIDAQAVVDIPEYALKNGKMYNVSTGDTWYRVANEYYPEYTADSIMKLVVYINNLPNNDLPLGEAIFLPSI